MKCVICGNTIGDRETRTHVNVYRDGKPNRKLYACSACGVDDGPFDRLIDALPVDSDNNPLDVSRSELEALKLATDRKRLKKRLRAARSVMKLAIRRDFGLGRFDFDKRTLTGDNGMVLYWATRSRPNEPVAYFNQQTTEGNVIYAYG